MLGGTSTDPDLPGGNCGDVGIGDTARTKWSCIFFVKRVPRETDGTSWNQLRCDFNEMVAQRL